MMTNYFSIIDESNSQLLSLINKYKIPCNQYFPVYGFSKIYPDIKNINALKNQQSDKVKSAIDAMKAQCKIIHNSIDEIQNDESISISNKSNSIMWLTCSGHLSLDEVEKYLRDYPNKSDTYYRRLLCAFDLKKYGS